MSIEWTPKVTVLDLETRLITLSVTRLDSEHPDNSRTYIAENVHINTAEQRLAVMNFILEERAEDLAHDAKVAALAIIIADLESQAKIYLENQET